MRIAYIVLCHKNAKQLNLLFKQLERHNCDIYVHVDKNSGDLDKKILTLPNLFILPLNDRIKVKWGGISQIYATLKLIRSVIDSGRQYDYVWLISGQDLPIKPAAAITDYLNVNNGAAFIDVGPTDTQRYKRLLKRNLVSHGAALSGKGFVRRLIRNGWYMITGGRYKTFKIFRRKLGGDIFYFGSQWWCLPYCAVTEMVFYLDRHPEFLKFFKRCHCPDESFFQTLLMNHTSYRDKVKPKLAYIDWTGCKDSPKTLSMDDYDALMTSDCLFARKFDSDTDGKIVDMLISRLKEAELADRPPDTRQDLA